MDAEIVSRGIWPQVEESLLYVVASQACDHLHLVNALRSRVSVLEFRSGLRVLAEDTGGDIIVNSNDSTARLEQH